MNKTMDATEVFSTLLSFQAARQQAALISV